MKIRIATIADLNRIDEIEKKAFAKDGFSRRQLSHLLRIGSIYALELPEHGIVGYNSWLYRRTSKKARYYSAAIHPDHTGKGYTKPLFDFAEKIARDRKMQALTAEVRIDNVKSINMLKGCGFEQIGVIKNYYEDGQDAYKMQKSLI